MSQITDMQHLIMVLIVQSALETDKSVVVMLTGIILIVVVHVPT